tara:strand:- start:684 stop:1262 length:579 start_codon:yes stop_codon:yes gene_type:complete
MKKTGKCVVISGPSGSGKTTLSNYLIGISKLNLNFSISATTRECRKGEIDGKNYYFLSLNDFKTKVKNNEFLETEEVYPNVFYGTLKSEINRIWGLEKNILFDVDVYGGLNIKKIYSESTISIFIDSPNKMTLNERLKSRGSESQSSLKARLKKSEIESQKSIHFDYIIMNKNLEQAKKKLYDIVFEFLNNE